MAFYNPPLRLRTGFTLVELLVVITILSLLGAIGFLSVQGYSKNARDSTRISDISNLSKALELMIAAGNTLSQPDENMITLYASGNVIGYQ